MTDASTVNNEGSRKTFRKTERLSSRKEIERLFANGASITASPLRLMYIAREELREIPAKSMFVVPKRNFRKAHDRNRLRRRMRESFRLQKSDLYEELVKKQRCISLALLFTARSEEKYPAIEKAMHELLRKLKGKL